MPDHRGIPIWQVEIPVEGLVSIHRNITLNARKEVRDTEAFYSEVRIIPQNFGFLAHLTAFAPTSTQAEKAGLVFLGRMLDVLSLQTDTSLNVLSKNIMIRRSNETRVMRVLDQNIFRDAFKESRLLTLSETTYLRALGWFRKGKYSIDPLDRFLSFWIAIETVASKYNPNKQNCSNRGSICHIWECFKHVWGECDEWPIINGKTDWIHIGNEKRVQIAHGTIAIDIESVNSIAVVLQEVESVCRQFLLDWRSKLTLEVDSTLME